MIRQLTLSLVALGFMAAAADAATAPVAPTQPAISVEASHVMTGRSAWHRHWHHHWHRWHHHH